MMMDRNHLEKLAESFQVKADTAVQNYQETGMSRYCSMARRNEDIADAIRMAAGAADEHQAYISMKNEMANFAWRAKMIAAAQTDEKRDELTRALIRDIVSFGCLFGLIGGD